VVVLLLLEAATVTAKGCRAQISEDAPEQVLAVAPAALDAPKHWHWQHQRQWLAQAPRVLVPSALEMALASAWAARELGCLPPSEPKAIYQEMQHVDIMNIAKTTMIGINYAVRVCFPCRAYRMKR
jgi:hypothetical protein